MKRAVFLDRDGVINRAVMRDGKPYAPALLDDLELLPGVERALERLRDAGFARIVVTNQPDIARGTTTREAVDAIHAYMLRDLALDEIRVCPHDDADDCPCRKPRPGMLLQPPPYDVASSYMVGDRWRDIEAGRAAACRATILVDYQYDEPLPHEPTVRVRSLEEAVDWILLQERL
jgi:D-glycero-D-manno-heptose 1,7-bisphosphate phosphatase